MQGIEVKQMGKSKITTVKRYVAGRCYACRWTDTDLDIILAQMAAGEAVFRPYNEATGAFFLISGLGRRIRK